MNRASKKLSFFTILFTAFTVWISYGFVFPIFAILLFQKSLHFFPLGTTEVERGLWLGILLAASPLAQFFSSTIIGTLSDQKGRKPILIHTSLLIMAGYLICAFGVHLESLFFLILGRVVTGVGAGNISIINSSMADLSTRNTKAQNFALITLVSGLGFTVGPFLGGLISSWSGYAMSFVFAGLVTLVSVFMLIFWFVETFIQKKENHQEMGERFKNLKKSLRLPGIPTLFLCFFIFSIGWSFYWDFIPVTWVEGYKQNASNVGNFYAYGSLFYVLSCAFFIRPILKKFQTEKILLVSWVFLGIVILPLLYSWLGMFWILLPFQQFAIALLLPAGATQISNSVDKYQQGAVLGAFQSVQSIAFASTPFLGGTAVGMNYNMPIIIGGIAMLLAGFVFFVGYRKTH